MQVLLAAEGSLFGAIQGQGHGSGKTGIDLIWGRTGSLPSESDFEFLTIDFDETDDSFCVADLKNAVDTRTHLQKFIRVDKVHKRRRVRFAFIVQRLH